MLEQFLKQNEDQILKKTEDKSRELAGDHPTSDRLKAGLPIFYGQIISIVRHANNPSTPPPKDIEKIADAADRNDEPAMAEAAGQPEEADLAKSAGLHGVELRKLGYSLSHVVHAYGAMCQAITETASEKEFPIAAAEFHTLNRCLDVAIAGAVTEFQAHSDSQENKDPVNTEMRNALNSAIVAFQSIKRGIVGVGGTTGQVLENSLKKMDKLLTP